MPKMKDLESVEADYPLTGPNQRTLVLPLEVPASRLFQCLEDGPAWKDWLGVDVEWTSPEPFGVGTTRTVKTNGQVIEEYFLTWIDGETMGFRFDRSTLPVKAMAELYDCVPTGPDSCELRWSYAFEWGGPLEPVLGRAFAAGFAFNAKRSLKKLAMLLEGSA